MPTPLFRNASQRAANTPSAKVPSAALRIREKSQGDLCLKLLEVHRQSLTERASLSTKHAVLPTHYQHQLLQTAKRRNEAKAAFATRVRWSGNKNPAQPMRSCPPFVLAFSICTGSNWQSCLAKWIQRPKKGGEGLRIKNNTSQEKVNRLTVIY